MQVSELICARTLLRRPFSSIVSAALSGLRLEMVQRFVTKASSSMNSPLCVVCLGAAMLSLENLREKKNKRRKDQGSTFSPVQININKYIYYIYYTFYSFLSSFVYYTHVKFVFKRHRSSYYKTI